MKLVLNFHSRVFLAQTLYANADSYFVALLELSRPFASEPLVHQMHVGDELVDALSGRCEPALRRVEHLPALK